jgi:hypothetical protein
MTITEQPASQALGLAERIRIADFTLHDADLEEEGGVSFKSTGDLSISDGEQRYGRLDHSALVGVVLDVDDDHSEVLVDRSALISDVRAMRRAAALLTRVADRLAALQAASAMSTMPVPKSVQDIVDAAYEIGVRPSRRRSSDGDVCLTPHQRAAPPKSRHGRGRSFVPDRDCHRTLGTMRRYPRAVSAFPARWTPKRIAGGSRFRRQPRECGLALGGGQGLTRLGKSDSENQPVGY